MLLNRSLVLLNRSLSRSLLTPCSIPQGSLTNVLVHLPFPAFIISWVHDERDREKGGGGRGVYVKGGGDKFDRIFNRWVDYCLSARERGGKEASD